MLSIGEIADEGNAKMNEQLEYPEIYWENIRHQKQLEILVRKYKNRNKDEEVDDDIDIEIRGNVCKTFPSETDAEQFRRRQIVDQQSPYYNDLYIEKKYDQKQLPQDQQKDVSKNRDFPELKTHRANGESRNLQEKKKMHQRRQVFFIITVVIFLLLLIGMATFTIYAWKQLNELSEIKTNLIVKQQQMLQNAVNESGIKKPKGLLDTLVGELQGHELSNQIQKMHFNVGLRTDYRLQECQSSHFKQTFPDVDYAFFGYNIIRGYPLSDGHDPGFTFPIFKIDYSKGGQSGDCRYSVPLGLIVIPDVSCITSFSSTVVQNKYEFSRSLSISAGASAGGGYGPISGSFSASAGFKYSTSEMSTGESVFIFSTAKCMYYFSKLIPDTPPKFSDGFLSWVYKLNNSDVQQDYFDFFDTYGTHFPSYLLFGARFTYKHRMKSDEFKKKRSIGANVAFEASVTAQVLTAGSSFSLDYSQQQTASSFSKSVETETITVGAPPPINGDPLTWAATVKESPVPMEYKLQNIEHLFSERFMKNINIDYETIAKNIKIFQYEYCNYLHSQGELDSCDSLTPGVLLEKSRLYMGYFKTRAVSSFGECVDVCLQNVNCEAISICKSCRWLTCYMFKNSNYKYVRAAVHQDWQSAIFTTKISTILELTDTTIIGVTRSSDRTQSINAQIECRYICIEDAYCVAYTFCECPDNIERCQLYAENGIKGLKTEHGTNTYFLSPREAIADESSTLHPMNITIKLV
ncbi:unnamed protein product [Mytilus coruscus]|uniref:MACPF domain-containing protein n=1 Tax=Mytilus coruscus TaxID=42192 RepID=A0A6J8AUT4_MYTCO|nr:unnamed protein product [Mytilus coruscus]